MKQKSAQELLKECIDRGIETAMETPAEDCRVPFDIGTEIQFDIWDEIRSAFYFEYESVSNRPVAIVRDWGRIEWQEGVFPNLGAKLYMSPQQDREWVGLTDHEIACLWGHANWGNTEYVKAFGRELEAKLKEKNT